MTKRRRIANCMIAGVLSLSFIMPTYATDLSDAQQKAQQLEEQKKAAESEKVFFGGTIEYHCDGHEKVRRGHDKKRVGNRKG